MLRLLSFFFFVVAAIEVILIPLGKLNMVAGFLAAATAIFFGALLYGLYAIKEEVRALREQVALSEGKGERQPALLGRAPHELI